MNQAPFERFMGPSLVIFLWIGRKGIFGVTKLMDGPSASCAAMRSCASGRVKVASKATRGGRFSDRCGKRSKLPGAEQDAFYPHRCICPGRVPCGTGYLQWKVGRPSRYCSNSAIISGCSSGATRFPYDSSRKSKSSQACPFLRSGCAISRQSSLRTVT